MHGRHDAPPLGVNRERGGDRVAAGVCVGGGALRAEDGVKRRGQNTATPVEVGLGCLVIPI